MIDYDDMILAALKDPGWTQTFASTSGKPSCFAVFEDEAQDSSPLQTQLC
jgi:DNA helicase-2/ATP-dependent DNA helicase PcrA